MPNDNLNEMEGFIDKNNTSTNSENNDREQNQPIDIPLPTSNNPTMQINDHVVNKPVMILVGPGNVGKTAVILRFARYLVSQKCTVTPNKSFAVGDQYAKNIKYFSEILYDKTQRIPDRNELGTYLLLDVYYENKPIFQILEAPGEEIFSLESNADNESFKNHMNTILNRDIPKIYTFFFSPDMFIEGQHKGQYDKRMEQIMKQKFYPDRGDQILLLYNKIDMETNLLGVGGKINEEQAYQNIRDQFPIVSSSIDDTRKNFKKTNVLFSTFSSGSFYEDKW